MQASSSGAQAHILASSAQFSIPDSPSQPGNLNFNPLPTVTAKCPKLKLHVVLDSQVYIAGSKLTGRLEIVSLSSSKLQLGEISVRLAGVEGVACLN